MRGCTYKLMSKSALLRGDSVYAGMYAQSNLAAWLILR